MPTPAQRSANRRNARKWPAVPPSLTVRFGSASLLQNQLLRANWLRLRQSALGAGPWDDGRIRAMKLSEDNLDHGHCRVAHESGAVEAYG